MDDLTSFKLGRVHRRQARNEHHRNGNDRNLFTKAKLRCQLHKSLALGLSCRLRSGWAKFHALFDFFRRQSGEGSLNRILKLLDLLYIVLKATAVIVVG